MGSGLLSALFQGLLSFLKGLWDKESAEATEDRAEALAAREKAKERTDEAQEKIDEAGDKAGDPDPESADVEKALEGLTNFSKKEEDK